VGNVDCGGELAKITVGRLNNLTTKLTVESKMPGATLGDSDSRF
jgi:hypothetical protein